MKKTRVDDMIIEMIQPKLDEINQKFSNGEKLSQDDINTLLLKSQYNHINHLDDKLSETTESVKELEHKFEKLEKDFERLELDVKKTLEEFKKDIELNIQKALNKNMMLLIVVIGFFMTLSKIIDKF